MLPKPDQKWEAFELGLTQKKWDQWLAGVKHESIEVALPKFSIRTPVELVDVLRDLGLRPVFDPTSARFKKMSQVKVFVSRVIHQAFVAVNEKGTQAAAATAVEMRLTAMPGEVESKVIRADRPFWFFVVNRETSRALFGGRVMGPSLGAE